MLDERGPQASPLYKLEMGPAQALWHHAPGWLCICTCAVPYVCAMPQDGAAWQALGALVYATLALTVGCGWVEMGRPERLLWGVCLLGCALCTGLFTWGGLSPWPVTPWPAEVSAFQFAVACGLLSLHAWTRGGVARVLLLVSIVVPYLALLGYTAEALGALRSATAAQPTVFLPLCFGICWASVLYVTLLQVWQMRLSLAYLRQSPLASALCAGLVAAILVLPVDMAAQAYGVWRWEHVLPNVLAQTPTWVPLLCGIAALALGWVIFRREQVQHLLPGGPFSSPHRSHVLWRLPLCWLGCAACCATCLWLGEGSEGPSLMLARAALMQWSVTAQQSMVRALGDAAALVLGRL